MSSLLWSEHFWLPENVTWTDFQSNSTLRYPQFHELRYTIAVGAVLLVVRFLVEAFVFLPIGVLLGWVDVRKRSLCARIIEHLNFGFCDRRSKFKRVAETAFRFTFYLFAWAAGLYVLRSQPQFYDITECWRNWPHHDLSSSVWWYYIVETGFYWSLLFRYSSGELVNMNVLCSYLKHVRPRRPPLGLSADDVAPLSDNCPALDGLHREFRARWHTHNPDTRHS
jgi:hypothetical protein